MTLALCILVLLAAVTSLALTAVVRQVAPRLGLVDRPDDRRKLHRRTIPLGGGLAVFFAMAAVLTALLFVPNPWKPQNYGNWLEMLSLPAAGLAMVILGLADDRLKLRGRHKLLGQTLIAGLLVVSGLTVHEIEIFGVHVVLGVLAVPATVVWLLAAINALNLLDGIDGLATTVGVLLVGTIGGLALVTGHPAVAVVAFVFVGALLGFLVFNFPPASIFLGDSGSMLIGLMVGALAIGGSLKGPGTLLLAAPLVMMTIPIFDSLAAILRRKLTGRSIYTTDRGHLHHCLLERFGSSRKVLLCVTAGCVVTSLGAYFSVVLQNDMIAAVSCGGVVGLFVSTGLFGRSEATLLATRLWALLPPLPRPWVSKPTSVRRTAVRLQGSKEWNPLWESLTDSIIPLGLESIHLDINIPREQEGFTAAWRRTVQAEPRQCWRLELPLTVKDQTIGRLTLTAQQNGHSVLENVVALRDSLASFQRNLTSLMEQTDDQTRSVPQPAMAVRPRRSNHLRRGESPISRKRPC